MLDKGQTARQIEARSSRFDPFAPLMLPIPKSQTDAIDIEIVVDDAEDGVVELRDSDVEMELGEADLVVVDAVATAPASSMRPRMPSIPPPLPRASQPEIVLPPVAHATPRPSRRTLDEKMVEDVTGQCLATIAEVTSRTRIPLSLVEAISAGDVPSSKKSRTAPPASSSHLVTPLMRPRPHEEPEEATEQNPTASVKPMLESTIRKKLPPISAPPFVRRSSASLLPSEREIVPRISPVAPSSTAIAMATDARRPLSDAPVSMSKLSEATQVVVVREPPKAYWVAVAAVIGAAAAIGGMRLTASSPSPAPKPAVQAAAEVPVVAPSPIAKDVVAPPAEKAPSAAVVRFGEGQGVAITAAPPAKSASHAPKVEPAKPVIAATTKPAVSSAPKSAGPASAVPRPPKLPDGSYGLARSDATPASPAKEAPAPAAPPPPAPEKKAKNLTPEQQLAEAQLKASMK